MNKAKWEKIRKVQKDLNLKIFGLSSLIPWSAFILTDKIVSTSLSRSLWEHVLKDFKK